MSGENPAISPDPVPRPHPDAIADLESTGRDSLGAAVGPQPFGLLGREAQQLRDRAAGTIYCVPLQQLGRGEEKRQRRRLEGLADQDCGDDGDGHEEVHVEPEPPRRPDSGAEEIEASDERGGRVEETGGIEPHREPAGPVERS